MESAAIGFEITGCLKAAAAIEADLNQLTAALTEAQFHAPARGGGWSAGYCIEHLILTGQAFLPKWDKALRDGGKSANHAETLLPYRWWQRRILHYVENPTVLRCKTSPMFVPYARHSIEETVDRFHKIHQEFFRRVAGSRGVDVKRTKVQSPGISWLRYALGFSFDLVLAHERRHLRQAWRVREELMDAHSTLFRSNLKEN